MEYVQNIVNKLNTYLINLDNNKVFSSVIAILLVLYGSLAAPKLPKNVALLFKNDIFKFLIIFMIAFMASKDTSIAIIASVGFLVSLQTLSFYETNNKILEVVEIKSRFKLKNLLNKFKNGNSNINFFPYIPIDNGLPTSVTSVNKDNKSDISVDISGDVSVDNGASINASTKL